MTRLTEDEIDSLDTCACGHWACEHTIDGCATVIPEEDGGEYEDDYGAYLCPCLCTPEAIRLAAVEALVAARDQAVREGTVSLRAPATPPTELWRVDFNVGGKPHHTWFDCEWHANQYADKITGALCWRVVER